MRRTKRYLTAASVAAALLTGTGVGAAKAATPLDPVQGAGCKSWAGTQRYGVGSVTAYGIYMSAHWCWDTGGSSSRITDIYGSASTWANVTFQAQSARGPADAYRNTIPSSWKSSQDSANIYYYFQSRNCLTGSLGVLCSGWTWHTLEYTLWYGGGITAGKAN